jgi:hypothetical protein
MSDNSGLKLVLDDLKQCIIAFDKGLDFSPRR